MGPLKIVHHRLPALAALAVLWAGACLSGCATGTSVHASGYVSPGKGMPSTGAVYIETAADAPNPLLSDLISAKSGQLLTGRGYRVVDTAAAADLVLRAEYAMSARSVMISRPSSNGFSPVQQVVVTGSGETVAVMSGNDAVTYVPETYTVYDSKLSLKFCSAADRTSVYWVGEAVAEGNEPDPRQTLDALVASAFKYFGQDTGRSRQLDVRADDPDVRRLSGSGV